MDQTLDAYVFMDIKVRGWVVRYSQCYESVDAKIQVRCLRDYDARCSRWFATRPCQVNIASEKNLVSWIPGLGLEGRAALGLRKGFMHGCMCAIYSFLLEIGYSEIDIEESRDIRHAKYHFYDNTVLYKKSAPSCFRTCSFYPITLA